MSTQKPRFLFSDPDLQVLRFSGTEGISQLYEFVIDLVAFSPDIDFDRFVGKPARLTILGSKSAERHVHGLITRLDVVGDAREVLYKRTVYRAVLAPPQIKLTLRRKLRVFQDMTTQQIVTQVLQEGGVSPASLSWTLKESYTPRNYCVQYRETDMDFVSRLLEEEGIAYHFQHTASEVKTVFSDHQAAFRPIAGKATVVYNTSAMQAAVEAVSSFGFGQQLRSGKVLLRDHSFKKPRVLLEGVAQGVDPSLDVYDYPGEFVEVGLAQRLATVRLQQLEGDRQLGHGATTCVRMTPGARFTLGGLPSERHPRTDLNQEYLLTQVVHQAQQPQVLEEEAPLRSMRYENTITAVPASVTHRARRVAPRPMALGTHTATVVGPPGEQIYVDEFGRVKVRFHWDREKKNSSWIRVSQQWAGAGYGRMFIPRVGQEVLVSFLEGDPDRPIVTGRVYNGEQMPPCALPEQKTCSTIRTSSTPPVSGAGDTNQGLQDGFSVEAGYNQLKFEDKEKHEEVLVHAQKDYNVVVKNDRTTVVKNDRTETTRRDEVVVVQNDRTLNVVQNSTHTATNITLQATDEITLHIGDSHLVLKPDTITIRTNSLVSAATSINEIKGGLVKINCAPVPPPMPMPTTLPLENWIDLVYQHNDKTGVAGAKYEVFDAVSKALLASGSLDSEGKALKVPLPPNKNRVVVRYSNDPKTLELFRPPKPHGRQAEGDPEEHRDALAVLDDIPD